ncbi:MAG: RNA polymerase sigma factor [Actinobacteria bacterium]|nr:RNA polymerase sigma factor [Actinomycetota bacterium]
MSNRHLRERPENPLAAEPVARGTGESLVAVVERAKRGDRGAFEDLVRTTYADAYALALRLTGDKDDACDILQDAYLKAYRALPRFRGDASFSTWLYRIIANCSASFLVKRGRNHCEELECAAVVPDTGPGSDPAAIAGTLMDRDRLATALAALAPRLRAVVVLRDVYDLPHQAIAAELGITEATAKVRLHRARKLLRQRLYEHPEDSSANRSSRSSVGQRRSLGQGRASASVASLGQNEALDGFVLGETRQTNAL